MDLIKLARESGLEPKRKASTYGGEYASSCPNCGGKDRFLIWPNQGRYWCRQCHQSGGVTRFCRKYLSSCQPERNDYSPIEPLQGRWEDSASCFMKACSQRLFIDSQSREKVKSRHLDIETLKAFQIGWNPIRRYDPKQQWGFPKSDRGKLFIPPGIVIPTVLLGKVRRLIIRRSDWRPGLPFGKYYVIPGSQKCFSILGYLKSKPIVIVEAELDAMLVWQECGDLCNVIATGGASKHPDIFSSLFLEEAPLILFAMDFDEAGKKAFQFWKTAFSHLYAWPVPRAKSPADAFTAGVDLRKWVQLGIEYNTRVSV